MPPTENFDPYRKWLGIPPNEQPPHLYRLLGIAPFENDPEVIENAADQRMAHVRTFQSGQNAAASQKILNELATAKICLLNAEKKAVYDQKLRAFLKPQPVTSVATDSPDNLDEGSSVDIGQYGIPTGTRHTTPRGNPIVHSKPRPWSNQKLGLVLGSIAAAVVFISGAIVILASGNKREETVVNLDPVTEKTTVKDHEKSKGKNHKKNGKGGSAEVTDSTDPNKGTSGTENTPMPDLEPLPPTPPKIDLTPTVDPPKPEVIPPTPMLEPVKPDPLKPEVLPPKPKRPAFLLTPVSDRAVNVLALIDPKTHNIVGDWRMQGTTLVSSNDRPVIQLPCSVPEEYVISISAMRQDGTGALAVGFVFGGKQCQLVLERATHWIGIDKIDDAQVNELRNPTVCAGYKAFRGSAPSAIHCIVRRNQMTVMVDGKQLIDWRGTSARVSPNYQLPRGVVGLYLLSETSTFAISQIMVTPLVDGRLPLPSEADISTADARLRKLLPDAAKLKIMPPDDRSRLATGLFQKAENVLEDGAERYVLLREALGMAAEAGKVEFAWKIADEFAQWFPIDPIEKLADALDRAKKMQLPAALCRPIAEQVAWLTDESVARNNVAGAERLLLLAKNFASRGTDAQLGTELTSRTGWLNIQKREAEATKKSQETLTNSDNDPDANLAIGKRTLLSYGEWSSALAYLAKSGSGPLSEIAQRDLQNAVLPDQQMSLADDWYKLAQALKKDDPLAARYYRRAKYWYESAVSNLAATDKTSVEKRLGDLSPGTGLNAEIYATPGGVFKQVYKKRIDHKIDFDWKTDSPDPPLVPKNDYGFRWSGWLAVPTAGEQVLVIDCIHQGRVWLDGVLILEPSGIESNRHQEVPLYLVSKPYSLKIEMFVTTNGQMKLSWRSGIGRPPRIIGPEFLFLQRDQAIKAMSSIR